MGERSITKLVMTDGTRKFYLHWGSPEYQIPRLGQWAYEMALHGEPLTVAAWEKWAAEINGERGGVVAAERHDGPNPGDIDHEYVITADDQGGFVAEYRHRSLGRAGGDLWRTVVLCNSVADWLTAGADQLTTYRAQLVRFRARQGWDDDEDICGEYAVSDVTAWRDECQERAAVYLSLFAPGVAIRRPDADALPQRREGQDEREHLLECLEFCTDAGRNTLALAARKLDEGDLTLSDELEAQARGLLVETYRIKALLH
ncbi:hypothetical protein ACWELJ_25890 [Nocardia sp. NPDC004582]